MLDQEPAQLRVSDPSEAGAGNHHDVQIPQFPAMMPEAVSDYPLYSVAAYRPGYLFARDRHTEASSAQAIGAGKQAYLLAAESQRFCKHPLEIARPGESEVAGEADSR